MRKMFVVACVLAGCATSTSPQRSTAKLPLASPVPETQTARAAASGKADPDNTFICEVERPTGSNIAVRTCRTVRRVEEERRVALDKMTDLQRTAAQCDDRHPCR